MKSVRGLKKIPYRYPDIPSDLAGWIDAVKYLPRDFDLCVLKTLSCNLLGWYTGNSWDGLNIKESDTVLSWKRIKD